MYGSRQWVGSDREADFKGGVFRAGPRLQTLQQQVLRIPGVSEWPGVLIKTAASYPQTPGDQLGNLGTMATGVTPLWAWSQTALR